MAQNNIPQADAISRLVTELNKLPGIGPKSAQRLAFFLLRSPQEQSEHLAEAILNLKQQIKLCSVCYNLTDSDPCTFCRNETRDRSIICVVEQPQDIIAIEHTSVPVPAPSPNSIFCFRNSSRPIGVIALSSALSCSAAVKAFCKASEYLLVILPL